MAKLSVPQLAECFDDCVGTIGDRQVSTGNLKSDWKILIDALDTAMDTEALTLNGYIPQPQRGSFTAKEKALALEIVIAKRYLL